MVMYLQEVMLVSLGATVDNISDQRIYYLVNDNKISLLCYQFFKKFTFECKCSSVFFSFSWNILVIFEYLLQRYSQDRIKHLRWGVLRKSLHLKCFAGFWIHLCSYRSRCLHVFYRKPGDKHFTEKS